MSLNTNNSMKIKAVNDLKELYVIQDKMNMGGGITHVYIEGVCYAITFLTEEQLAKLNSVLNEALTENIEQCEKNAKVWIFEEE